MKQLLMDDITTDSVMIVNISSLSYMTRSKSTSTLTSSNAPSPIVWSVIVLNVSNAISSLITFSMNLQGYANYASWIIAFNAKHSLHADSVMKIQAIS